MFCSCFGVGYKKSIFLFLIFIENAFLDRRYLENDTRYRFFIEDFFDEFDEFNQYLF